MKKIIAVDGPAAAGKSTISKIIAKQLGYTYIDTGAMYRAIALKILMSNKNLDESLVKDTNIFLEESGHIFLDGIDVTEKIRTPDVSRKASDISKIDFVREKLTELQIKMAENGSVIMDGRDIGTKVLPNADLKIFLTATLDERAERRYEEFKAKGLSVDFEQIRQEILLRDEQDRTRKIAPLTKANDEILIDSTSMSIEEVVSKILHLAGKD